MGPISRQIGTAVYMQGLTGDEPGMPSSFCGGLRHGIDRGDAFPSSTIYDGAFTSSAEADAQIEL
jgi:hypothetical protein